ncbi:MAG: MarR family winged helix-turn-helix transcriptional regulator [Acidimicrobiales bacterium]
MEGPLNRESVNAVADAVLVASRVLVAVAAESLADLDDITLAQYRALVILASRGAQNLSSLAEALAVNPSTATRAVDRLVSRDLVIRETAEDDRREVRLAVTTSGAEIVRTVTRRRRLALARIVRRLDPGCRASLVDSLRAFAEAAGEVPDHSWSLGWST